jgi:hypothetical protein
LIIDSLTVPYIFIDPGKPTKAWAHVSAREIEIKRMDGRTKESKEIRKFLEDGKDTKLPPFEIGELFSVSRGAENERMENFSDTDKLVLIHGTNNTSLPGIFGDGLQISPPGGKEHFVFF